MLQACVDDSGRGQDPVFILAGYVGRDRNWIELDRKWRDLLRKHRLKYLKGTEAGNLAGQFNRWTAEKRDDLVLQFVRLIKQYALIGVRVVIPHQDFRRSLRFDAMVRRGRWYFKQPYFVAFDCVFGAVLSYARKRSQFEKVDFIFDNGLVDRRNLSFAYDPLLKSLGSDVLLLAGAPIFRDDKDFAPLQAADLLAWHIRRDFYERSNGRSFESQVWSSLSEFNEIQVDLNRKELADVRSSTVAAMIGKYP